MYGSFCKMNKKVEALIKMQYNRYIALYRPRGKIGLQFLREGVQAIQEKFFKFDKTYNDFRKSEYNSL